MCSCERSFSRLVSGSLKKCIHSKRTTCAPQERMCRFNSRPFFCACSPLKRARQYAHFPLRTFRSPLAEIYSPISIWTNLAFKCHLHLLVLRVTAPRKVNLNEREEKSRGAGDFCEISPRTKEKTREKVKTAAFSAGGDFFAAQKKSTEKRGRRRRFASGSSRSAAGFLLICKIRDHRVLSSIQSFGNSDPCPYYPTRSACWKRVFLSWSNSAFHCVFFVETLIFLVICAVWMQFRVHLSRIPNYPNEGALLLWHFCICCKLGPCRWWNLLKYLIFFLRNTNDTHYTYIKILSTMKWRILLLASFYCLFLRYLYVLLFLFKRKQWRILCCVVYVTQIKCCIRHRKNLTKQNKSTGFPFSLLRYGLNQTLNKIQKVGLLMDQGCCTIRSRFSYNCICANFYYKSYQQGKCKFIVAAVPDHLNENYKKSWKKVPEMKLSEKMSQKINIKFK